MTRRSASLRQTRTAQISLEIPPAPTPQTSSSPPAGGHYNTNPAKKSNWEVIEHFNPGSKSRGSVSSSLIAVRSLHHTHITPHHLLIYSNIFIGWCNTI